MRRECIKTVRVIGLLALIGLVPSHLSLYAQNIPGYGWSSFGVLPFGAYNFVVGRAPDRYVMYFTKQPANNIQGSSIIPGRAFSTDLKTWTADPNDVCSTSGDLCLVSPSRAGVLQLPDGRLRMFLLTDGLSSAISSDGVVWTREAGTRFKSDQSSIYERANNTTRFVSFVTLPDGSVRMYYRGGVTPGSAGTPAYYNNPFESGMILSALSKDNGLTWVREPGVRINPLVQGPVAKLAMPDGSTQNQFDCQDFSAITTQENGNRIFRVFCSALAEGTVTYVSDDGLSFVLEGQVPVDRDGPKALIMADGRIWLVPNGPNGITDTVVYGPQPMFVSSTRGSGPVFQSTMIGVTGSSSEPVTLEAVLGDPSCPNTPCLFHPEYYSFSPSSGTPPFTSVLTYVGPANYAVAMLVVHGRTTSSTAAGAVYCMQQVLGRADTTVFCQPRAADLPMNRMTFAFSIGAKASFQTSSILSLGGVGYPFTATSSVPWATVSAASGTAPAPITVTVNPTGLAAGTYTGTITISAEATTQKIVVTATISAGPVITAVQNAGSGTTVTAGGTFVTIYGAGFAASPVSWTPTTSLPAILGGVSVKVNGQDCFISYADSGQINVLTPTLSGQDVASGTVQFEVTTAAGKTTASAPVSPVGPAWFTYSTGGPTWIAALIANTATYVAPAGTFGPGASRSARAGDYLALYANGLGTTIPAAPTGAVLTTAYALDDFSRVKIFIGGHDVPVLYAGLVGAGLYQINVQVPQGLGTGELPVLMMVNGLPTQGGVTLNFQ